MPEVSVAKENSAPEGLGLPRSAVAQQSTIVQSPTAEIRTVSFLIR